MAFSLARPLFNGRLNTVVRASPKRVKIIGKAEAWRGSIKFRFVTTLILALSPTTQAQESFDRPAHLEERTTQEIERTTIPQPHTHDHFDDSPGPFLQWPHLTNGWFGLRHKLSNAGILFDLVAAIDFSRNLSGGIDSSRTVAPYLFAASLSVDSEKLGLFPGGLLFIDVQRIGGSSGTAIVNDFQVFSNIAAESRTQLAQLWYEQQIVGEYLRLKIGKMDANSDFAYVDHGLLFLHSSMGLSPTIQSMPTYPDTAYGIEVIGRTATGVYGRVGVYDGALQRGVRTGLHGPVLDDIFAIGESGLTWSAAAADLSGRLGIGIWYHNGDFDRFDGGTNDGTEGAYLTFDQLVYREIPDDDDQGIGWFVQYGYADPDVSPVDHHIGTGLTWTGALPHRDADALGLGISIVHFSQASGATFSTYETATELFYTLQLTGFASLTLDLQAITNPGGIAAQPDALTGTTRLVLHF